MRSQSPGRATPRPWRRLIRAPSFQDADKLAAKLLADPAIDAQTKALCGLAVLKAGRIAEAEAIFNKVIERSPDSPDAHLGLGRIAHIRNDEDKAVAHTPEGRPVRLVPSKKRSGSSGGPPGPAASSPTSPRSAFSPRSATDWRRCPRLHGSRTTWARSPGSTESGSSIWPGASRRLKVPLVTSSSHPRIRMIALKLNGKADRLFHLDSALAEFMTITPLLAEELGLIRDRQRVVHRRRDGRHRDPLRRPGQGRDRPADSSGTSRSWSPTSVRSGDLKKASSGRLFSSASTSPSTSRPRSWTSIRSTAPTSSPPASTGPPWRRTCRSIASMRRPSRPLSRSASRPLHPGLGGGHEPRGPALLRGARQAEARPGPHRPGRYPGRGRPADRQSGRGPGGPARSAPLRQPGVQRVPDGGPERHPGPVRRGPSGKPSPLALPGPHGFQNGRLILERYPKPPGRQG
ncbi:MAG: hypothetical protein MZV70_70510 [Desulfobacterales bacterium]|nr:hypothetical protein [Desulfobacterales bacterium]